MEKLVILILNIKEATFNYSNFKNLLCWTTLMLIMMSQSSLSIAQNKVTIGRIEKIRIYPGNMAMRAKIDTGAKTSSLGCENINIFEREGTKWVRFKVTNYKGTTKMLERKVERTVIIKRHFGRKQERVVVRLGICLGTIYREAEVSLIDRSGFNYQILIGRTFLIDNHIIVDPSQKYTVQPACKEVSKSD